jgi:SAM-dependent methyltransferase
VRLVAAQPAAQRVLDVGCASGWFEFLCTGRLDTAISAIDLEPATIEQARRNAPHADYAAASVFSLPFADATFDGAVMFEVIEHVPRQSEIAALKEVRRVLKRGGWLILSTPFAHPVSTVLDPAWYFGHRHYSHDRIVSIMADAGFRTVTSIVRGGLWELWGNITLYAFKWLLRSEPPLKSLIERRREREFLTERTGICNIFVQAVAD